MKNDIITIRLIGKVLKKSLHYIQQIPYTPIKYCILKSEAEHCGVLSVLISTRVCDCCG